MMRFCLLVICLSLSGCELFGGRSFGGFRDVPDYWTDFTGNGVSVTQIKTALLECGMDTPSSQVHLKSDQIRYMRRNGMEIPDDLKAAELPRPDLSAVEECMFKSGFEVKARNCLSGINKSPVCQPGGVIPSRSVERRLNSPYCKEYPESRFCQVVVIEPPPEPAKSALPPRPKSDLELERERNRMEQQRMQQQNDWLKRKGGF